MRDRHRRSAGILSALLLLGALSWLHASCQAASATLPGAARAILGPDQGVYVEAVDGTPLLAQAADRAVHPASVSKVPTTLALLRKFGGGYRFTTTFSIDGEVRDGTLYGDLIVHSEGDPSLVDENALMIAGRLRAAGIVRIAGRLRLEGPLTFDWQPDADGHLLRTALTGQVPASALEAIAALQMSAVPGTSVPAGTRAATALPPPPFAGVAFADPASGSPADLARSSAELAQRPRPLLVHRSQPLLELAKSLNDYSNNIFKPLADEAGGATAIQELARSILPPSMRGEVTLGDGAGTDPRNRLSPRAAVRLLRALDEELALHGHSLADILPVAGIDPGTLQKRLNAPGEIGRVAGKTGTFGDFGASALVGAIPTADRGTVYFAILNHNVPVPEARRRQDRLVSVLLGQLHSLPWKYEPDIRPAVQRAELVSLAP